MPSRAAAETRSYACICTRSRAGGCSHAHARDGIQCANGCADARVCAWTL